MWVSGGIGDALPNFFSLAGLALRNNQLCKVKQERLLLDPTRSNSIKSISTAERPVKRICLRIRK